MGKPKVFVSRIIPDAGLSIVINSCDADVWPEELPPSRDAIMQKVRGMDGILSLITDRIDGDVMDAAGDSLKIISNYAGCINFFMSF